MIDDRSADIGVAGGPGAPGQYNLVEPRHGAVGDISPEEIGYGSGFQLWVDYRPSGLRAESLLTYGQSGDRSPPHHRDQTHLAAAG